MVELDVSHTVILGDDFLPVLMDFLRRGIKLRPFVVRLECRLICVCGNVTYPTKIMSVCVSESDAGLRVGSVHIQAHPGYLFSNQVPPTSEFFSYTWSDRFDSLWGSRIDANIPEMPAPTTITRSGRKSSMHRGSIHCCGAASPMMKQLPQRTKSSIKYECQFHLD